MSYQVLARKWRPRGFESLVGQEHVVRALRHALEQRRLARGLELGGARLGFRAVLFPRRLAAEDVA